MKDYSKGKIYKIVGNGFTYYGSTCEPTLARRLAKHIRQYKDFLLGKKNYMTSFKCFENDNKDYYIVLAENYPCQDNDELCARERYYIENNNCVNKYIPGRTNKEYKKDTGADKKYYIKHKSEIQIQRKKYYEKNKEAIRNKGNKKCSCICGGLFTHCHKAQHLKSNKHIDFMNRFNSKDMEISFSAIKELHERRHKN